MTGQWEVIQSCENKKLFSRKHLTPCNFVVSAILSKQSPSKLQTAEFPFDRIVPTFNREHLLARAPPLTSTHPPSRDVSHCQVISSQGKYLLSHRFVCEVYSFPKENIFFSQ